MDDNFIEIYCKDILTEIKQKVKSSVSVGEARAKSVDKKILETIKSLVEENKSKNNKSVYTLKALMLPIEEKDRLIKTLTLYYAALYFDNLKLLERLIEKNYNWNYYYGIFKNICVLDNRLSSKFELEEYVNLVLHTSKLIVHFINDLGKHNEIMSDEEAINRFVLLLRVNPNIGYNVEKKEKYDLLIDKIKLSYFDNDVLLNLSDNQKGLICDDCFGDRIRYIANLINNYGFDKHFTLYSWFMRDFTEEEISKLSQGNINAISEIYDSTSMLQIEDNDYLRTNIDKIKKIIEENPCFDRKLDHHIYEALTEEQILSLTDEIAYRMNGIMHHIHYMITFDHVDYSYGQIILCMKNEYNKSKIKQWVKSLVKKEK